MATYAEELAEEQGKHQRNKRWYFKSLGIVAVLVLVPMATSLVMMHFKQDIPRQSVVATSYSCDSYTQLAKKEGAPSPVYAMNGKRCEIQNYDAFVSEANSYNRGRTLPIG